MRLISLAAALAIAGVSALPATAAKPRDPEARIAEALKGRVAGTPTDCIQLNQIRSLRIIDRTAIIYQMAGNRLYLNRPTSGAAQMMANDVLITDTRSPQLCNVDIVRLSDPSIGFPRGAIGLGDFVPYDKPGRR